ncbi:MAG: hypothetical protein KatS3mg014_2441 [Actinomycetota bacterium]|nr:MAG: hypothetical protein KatS3mg014_2441 [Actinomycetota bacterium]
MSLLPEDIHPWRRLRPPGWWSVVRVEDERAAYSGPDEATARDVADMLRRRGVPVVLVRGPEPGEEEQGR